MTSLLGPPALPESREPHRVSADGGAAAAHGTEAATSGCRHRRLRGISLWSLSPSHEPRVSGTDRRQRRRQPGVRDGFPTAGRPSLLSGPRPAGGPLCRGEVLRQPGRTPPRLEGTSRHAAGKPDPRAALPTPRQEGAGSPPEVLGWRRRRGDLWCQPAQPGLAAGGGRARGEVAPAWRFLSPGGCPADTLAACLPRSRPGHLQAWHPGRLLTPGASGPACHLVPAHPPLHVDNMRLS